MKGIRMLPFRAEQNTALPVVTLVNSAAEASGSLVKLDSGSRLAGYKSF
jgi:hypothetical protein